MNRFAVRKQGLAVSAFRSFLLKKEKKKKKRRKKKIFFFFFFHAFVFRILGFFFFFFFFCLIFVCFCSKNMRFFCLLAFVAVALCQDSPPIRGTATVTIDLRGLSPDVSVSFSTDLANVYRGQGGGIRTYTVPTTNSIQNVQVVITEGGVATFSASSPLTNGGTWTVNGHLAQLRVHLENYAADVPSGNYFNVKLRVTIAGQEQVFREYNDFASPSSSSVVPLSELGPIPSSTFYTVTVLAVTQPVTVFAGEWYGAVQAVWVVGHNGNGQIVDSNCRDLVCDSGRLVARATYQLACDGSFDYQLPASTRVTLWSNPSPTVSDVQIVRRSFNVPSSTFSRHVLAVDNYQFIVENGNVKKVAALNCAIGECEAAPLVSILSVFSSTLRGTVQVSVEGNLFSTPYNIVRDETRICVLNLPLTEVTASFTTGGVVVQRNIDCGDVNQRCNTYVYGTLTPNYSCLPTSGLSVAVVVAAADGTPVYQRFGVAASSIVVPALAGLKLKIYDGASAWAPSGFFPPAVNAFEYVEQSVTDCSAFQDVNTNHQDGNRPGACTVTERADRMLSIFDLAFLPQWEPGFLGSGQLPPNGPNTSVTVTLQLPGAQVFRVVTNQGGAPRMYCVLPNLIEAKITENTACYTSEAQDCRPINPAGLADCSVCDFLSVLQYDLKGLPREVNSQIYVGPVEGARTTLINQDFSVFGSGACNRLVNGSSIGFYNLSPRSEEIEIWGQGCSGAPATFPANNGPAGGQATGNTLKVGRIENSKKSVVAPHLDRTCVTFNTPQFSEAINVGFYAWQHGNAAFQNQLAYVTAVGSLSGSSLRAWINFNRGQWNWNSIRLLDTLPEEQVTVCWVQSGQFGLNIDNVVVDTDVYPLTLIRSMAWQGNFFNQIPVLRAGAGLGCPYGVYQRYCIRVIDGSAWKQECTVCNDRTCMPMNPFACEMCLNLASPNDTPGLENQIRLSISFGNGNVRSVDGQGGTNGCARNKRADNELRTTFARLEQRITEARGLTSKVCFVVLCFILFCLFCFVLFCVLFCFFFFFFFFVFLFCFVFVLFFVFCFVWFFLKYVFSPRCFSLWSSMRLRSSVVKLWRR